MTRSADNDHSESHREPSARIGSEADGARPPEPPPPGAAGRARHPVFQPLQLGALRLRNRVVMAPMTRRMAGEDGVPTEAMVAYYRRRAAHEVGLIISEGTAIDSKHAYDTPTVPRFETDAQIAGWERVVRAVHVEGGAFAPQLWHTGRLAQDPIGPSAAEMPPRRDGAPRPRVRAMDASDFTQVLGAFADAARRAREIGCDAIEIHGAHGYLLDSFLSAAANRRTDAYGGTPRNRMRFPLEVVRAVREAVGIDFPIIYRFSQWKVDDQTEIKFKSPEDLALWVLALRDAGVDILHASTLRAVEPAFASADESEGDATTTEGPQCSERTLAAWTRHLSGLPVIAVGAVSAALTMDQSYGTVPDAVTDPWPAIQLIDRGEADLLAVGRALIANPDWVRIVRDRDWRELVPYDRAMLDTLD